ncbi:MAG: hypothetical protein PF444_01210, partial [Bacteroidales bacterium]|nr:hypothetical protein [Bacteroidales bacterium]
MNIIDNKSTLLLDELDRSVNSTSNIYISCNYFTSFALYEIISMLDKANSVKMLLSYTPQDMENFLFLQSQEEYQLNLDLNRSYKVSKVIDVLESKVKIRKGNVGNQNLIMVQNGDISLCYAIT